MPKKKVLIVSLNRSEYSRIRSAIKAVRARTDLEVKIAVLQSKYTNTALLFEEDKIPVDYKVNLSIGERTMANTASAVGETAIKFAEVFAKEKPDVLLILGDRYEALGVVIAAAFQNIFIAHIQGGEVTGTHDEHTRHAITKLSHLHFPATTLSAERIIKMGEKPEMVIAVGCPGTDSLLEAKKLSFEELRYELYRLAKRPEVLERFAPGFMLVLQFPVPTESGKEKDHIQATLSALSKFDMPKLILTPIPDAGGDVVEASVRAYEREDSKAVVLKHVPVDIFANLLRHASVMIGNSSSGIRETGYFGLPTVNIGSRQNGRERSANILDVSNDEKAIEDAIKHQLAHGRYETEMIYGTGDAGKLIAEALAVVDHSNIQKQITY